ncbi:uncharacterized protein TNCV_365921 [Trichonephila clavipes]|nr:uncharacterized protein TNCV_365921 [Trichonephila clavipes]
MDEILTTARDLELEVNEDDIEELIMGHEDELTTEELQEILNEEHQETQRNVSHSEQEEDEGGPTPISAIKDLLKKLADVRAMVLEWTQTRLISLSAKPKTHHPDEEHKPHLPDSITRPITNMPLSRMENTTFAMPSIIDSHDMGLRTVFTVQTPKRKRLFNAYSIKEHDDWPSISQDLNRFDSKLWSALESKVFQNGYPY